MKNIVSKAIKIEDIAWNIKGLSAAEEDIFDPIVFCYVTQLLKLKQLITGRGKSMRKTTFEDLFHNQSASSDLKFSIILYQTCEKP